MKSDELKYHPPGTECYAVDMRLNLRRVKVTDTVIWMKEDPAMGSITHVVRAIDGGEKRDLMFGGNVEFEHLHLTVEEAEAEKVRRIELMRAWT